MMRVLREYWAGSRGRGRPIVRPSDLPRAVNYRFSPDRLDAFKFRSDLAEYGEIRFH